MKRPEIMHGWEVQWCYELPKVEGTNDADIDRAKYGTKDFRLKPDALKFAEKVLPIDQFGSVRVTEFEMLEYEAGVPAWYKEDVSDPIYVD